MKRFLVLFVIMLFALSFESLSVKNVDVTVDLNDNSKIILLDDGYYLEISDVCDTSNLRTSNVSKNKKAELKDANGSVVCSLTVYATFTVNTGTSIKCIGSTYSKSSYDSAWDVYSPIATYSNNTTTATATATGVAKRKVLGVVVKNINMSVSITGTKNGSFT